MRKAGVCALLYPSARDPRGGVCVAVLDACAFARPRPTAQSDLGLFRDQRCCRISTPRIYESVRTVSFELSMFLVDGRLPQPAL